MSRAREAGTHRGARVCTVECTRAVNNPVHGGTEERLCECQFQVWQEDKRVFQAGEAACVKTFWTWLHRSSQEPWASEARQGDGKQCWKSKGCCLWLAWGAGEPAKWQRSSGIHGERLVVWRTGTEQDLNQGREGKEKGKRLVKLWKWVQRSLANDWEL